jgi:muconolactone D-isomerase
MLFMVRIKVDLPGQMDPARVEALGAAEADRAIELIQAGKLRKVWRIVGARANFSVWEADTLEEFHVNIS